MDVNGPAECAAILRFEALEPKDARHDRVATGGVHGNDFAGGLAVLELHSERSASANLLRDLEIPQRSRIAAWAIAEAELRGRDVVSRNLLSVFVNGHLLV